MSRGSVQMTGGIEQPLQNSTAIGDENTPSIRPRLTHYGTNTVYVPPVVDNRQTAASMGMATQLQPSQQLGPRERTNLPVAELPTIDAKMAQAMRKVSIRPFAADLGNGLGGVMISKSRCWGRESLNVFG